jgi:hypothetical protein
MKRTLLTAALVLAAAPSATAAPFGEVPFRAAGGTATCLRATGSPGEVVRSTPTGAQFLQAGPGGLVPVAEVKTTPQTARCPAAAGRANGAGVLAFVSYSPSESGSRIRAALREPGGAWGAPVDLASVAQLAEGQALAADVSERDDALVAFAGGEPRRWEVRAVRRAPGGAFAAPEKIFAAPRRATSSMRVAAGLSAAGEAVVAWSYQPRSGAPREVWAAVAAAGAPFGPPARIGTLRTGAAFALAVGAGGHALVTFPGGDDVLVAERGPGAGFGPAARVGAATDRVAVYTTVAVRPDGGAIVAWQNALAGDLRAVVRPRPGRFSAPMTLAPDSGLRYPKRLLALFDAFSDEDLGEVTSDGPDDDGSFPRAVIAPDGRALVTAPGYERRDGLWFGGPRVTTVPVTGGASESHILGAELREADGMIPLLSADATAAVAWTDNNDDERDGRLHLALEGVPDATDPAPPEVRLIGSRRRVLAPNADLRFRVRCSAACDVRVQLGHGLLAPGAIVSRTRAGTEEIRLYGLYGPLATLRGGPAELYLRYGAPGARRATARTVTLNLRRLPDAPRPRVLDAVARREGKAIVVTWSTDRDAEPGNFAVYPAKTRDEPLAPFDAFTIESGADFTDDEVTGSGRRFSARIVEDAARARYVRIVAHVKGARKVDTTTVRVRR